MASPGKPLLTIYDPAAMRVVINVPQSRVSALRQEAAVIEIPGAPPALTSIKAPAMSVLPTADPVSQMVQVRFALPSRAGGVSPGMFARARLAVAAPGQQKRLSIPSQAVFRRSELTAVYVLDKSGQPQLRLIRSGRVSAGRTEVLSGLDGGEKVVLDPLAANPQH
jgi:multidrug efflux pump subunit AcrA (membrane-fusion protein)